MKGVFSAILEVHISTTTTVLVTQNFLHTNDTVETFHNGTAEEKRFLLSFDEETHHNMQQYVSISTDILPLSHLFP